MTFPIDPHAQPLHDWLKARAAGEVPPPASDPELADLLATAHQLDHLAHRYGEAALRNRSSRHHSWGGYMSRLSTTTSPAASGIAAAPAMGRNPGGLAWLRRWQPAISLAIVLVLLGGLFAIAWDRQSLDPNPTPTMLAALQNDESTPHPIESIDFDPDCVAQDLGPAAQTNGQWSSPNYTPASAWEGDHQLRIFQTFLTYLACQDERGGGDMPSDDERTFLSPRLLFLLGSNNPSALMGPGTNLDPTESVSNVVWGGQVIPEMFDPTQRIISDFPLPLNQYPTNDLLVGRSGEWITVPFYPRDIYSLPNQRFAAIGGTITTHMLQTGVPVRTGDGELVYVSFILQGDGYVIDEFFLICPSDIRASLAGDTEGSLPQQEPFDPAELIRNPEATCG